MKTKKNWIERARAVTNARANSVYTVLKYWQQYEGLQFTDADIKFFASRLTSPETILRDSRRYKLLSYQQNVQRAQEEVQQWMEESKVDNTQAS